MYGDEFTAYIVGLGFASNKATMISYMVPFDLMVRDIEMVTGRRVVEPVWEGDPRGTTPDSAWTCTQKPSSAQSKESYKPAR